MTGPGRTPAAVLFDCDGVIVDSERPLFDLLEGDFARYGLPMPRDEIMQTFVGGTMYDVGRRARAHGATMPEGWEEDFYERLFRVLAKDAPLIPGIVDVLDALDAAGIGYAVGSNGSGRKMDVTLGQHPDVLRRFQGRLFSGQDMNCPKPAPDLYLHAAAALATPPEACVVVEDSPTGARAARAAGIPCFGYAPHDDGAGLAAVGARVFHDMRDLPGLWGL